MSLLGGLIQLLQNTVSSVNLSVFTTTAVAGDILATHTTAVGGVFHMELHMLDIPAQAVVVRVNGADVFCPATTTASGAGAYNIQFTALLGQHIQLVALVDVGVVYADLIITQIG